MYNHDMDFSNAVDLGKKERLRAVEETNIGVYVWELPDGRWVGDEDGNWMLIQAKKGDLKRIAQLQDAARSYGVEEGRPVFLSGHRPVDDETYEEQRQRMMLGLVPDKEDNFSQLDDLKYGRT